MRSDSGFRYGLCCGPSNNCCFARSCWVGCAFCPTAKLHRDHCSLVQLFKNTKVRWVSQITPVQCAFGRRCVFNDLCESTKTVSGLQGSGLLKRWNVVGKRGICVEARRGLILPLKFSAAPTALPRHAPRRAGTGGAGGAGGAGGMTMGRGWWPTLAVAEREGQSGKTRASE